MWFQVQCSQIFFLIISLITFNPLLTGDVESSQATTVHFLCCFSVAKSCPTLCSPMDCSTSGFCPSLSPRVCSNSCPLGWWCHPIILSSCYPLLLLPSIFPSIRVFSSKLDLCIRCPSIRASASAPTHAMKFLGLISFRSDWFDLLARDSQESSPASKFKSINSKIISILYRSHIYFQEPRNCI